MKFLSKALVALLAVVLLISALPVTQAAQTDYEVESGKTARLKMVFTNIDGLQIKEVKVSNPDMVVSKEYDDSGLGMDPIAENGDQVTWMKMPVGVVEQAVLVLKVRVKGNVGDVCKVTVTYVVSSNSGLTSTEGASEFTITIKEQQATEPKPTVPEVTVDYTELNSQISVAQGLEQGKYTTDSWTALQSALTDAQAALKSKNQSVVDAAAETLKNAIAALVKMDYAALMAAIDAAKQLQESDEGGALWTELSEALTQALEALNSGDQAAVDAAAERVLNAISAIQRYLENQGEAPTEGETKPTKPTDEKIECNTPSHKTWPILFWVSLVVNIALIVLIVAYVIAKKKNHKDTTPLVEYNIEDDDE